MAAAAGWAATDFGAGPAARRSTLVAVGLLLATLLCLIGGGLPAAPLTTEREPVRLGAYRHMPLAFVPNRGRVDPDVRYTAQTGGAGFFFTDSEVVASFARGKRGVALRLRFLDANPDPAIVGARPAGGKVNYLVGDDPAEWRRSIPTYGELVYRDLWPGVSMHVRSGEGTLKYEFRVQRGVDPSRIRLARARARADLGRRDGSGTGRRLAGPGTRT